MTLQTKIHRILKEEKTPKVAGTNCGNCKFFTGKEAPVKSSELNEQGGIAAPDEKHLKMAEKGDLITLPGKGTADVKRMCSHKEIAQFVTDRMCCAYWDNPGAKREWKE